MSKTYLELVNRVIDECKISLDPLTSADFDSPPRSDMYNRVKRWINDAYEELLTTRNEWFWRVERANVVLYPRLHLYDTLVPPMVGYVYRSVVSEVEFTVRAVHTFEDVENDGATEYTVSVEFADDAQFNDLYIGEMLDVISPAPTSNAAIFKGQGYYDFVELVPGSESINERSMRLYPPVPEEAAPFDEYNTGSTLNKQGSPVYFVSWDEFWSKNGNWPSLNSSPAPYFMTRTFLGSYVFMPALSEKVVASFEYVRDIPVLTAWDDVPVAVPSKYHLYLMWRACRSFADFDGNGKLFSRFKKEEDKFMLWMERDESPKVTMGSDRFRVR